MLIAGNHILTAAVSEELLASGKIQDVTFDEEGRPSKQVRHVCVGWPYSRWVSRSCLSLRASRAVHVRITAIVLSPSRLFLSVRYPHAAAVLYDCS